MSFLNLLKTFNLGLRKTTLFPHSYFTGVCDVLINVYNYNKYTGLNRFENKNNCLLVMVEGDELYGEAPVAAQHEAGVRLLRAWGGCSSEVKVSAEVSYNYQLALLFIFMNVQISG